MKTRATLFTIIFFTILNISFAQKRKRSPKLILGNTSIAKYHTLEELDKISKGGLLNLYTRRIEIIVSILPNIAFATKPNVTMASLGIPETKENIKALQKSHEAYIEYFNSTVEFQKSLLPYSDKDDLKSAILFYEETLKSLHTYNDFKTD